MIILVVDESDESDESEEDESEEDESVPSEIVKCVQDYMRRHDPDIEMIRPSMDFRSPRLHTHLLMDVKVAEPGKRKLPPAHRSSGNPKTGRF